MSTSEKSKYDELLQNVTESVKIQSQFKTTKNSQHLGWRSRIKNYFDHVQVIVVALNCEGRITLINQKGCQVFGWDESELIDQNWFSTCLPQPEGWDEVYPFFLKLLAGEVRSGEYFENPIITREGELRYIAWQNTLLHDEQCDIIGILSTGEDVTEKRKAERVLLESREEIAELFSMSLDMICVADINDFTLLKVNPAFTKIIGYLEEEILNRTFLDFIHPDDVNPMIDMIGEKFRKGRQILNYTSRFRCRDGVYRWLEWVINPIVNRGITFIIGHDITPNILADKEKKKLESQLQRAHRLEEMGTLAGGIAHDFNNLLMGIQGRVSLMAMDLDPEHPYFDHIVAIEENIRSATGLTKQLLGGARGGKYEVKPIDVNQVLINSSKMFGRIKKELPIHTKLGASPLIVEADRRQLEQVLLNMYINAWQAMPNGGTLFLETARMWLGEDHLRPHRVKPGSYIKVSVTDKGIGMDEATRQRIFDPFFTTKEKSRGTGLGLALADGIIKNHGGMITVYSELEYGTTFNIYLPASTKALQADVSMTRHLKQGTECILLVDDEKIILEVGKNMLERMGYSVLVADRGEEAINIIKEHGNAIDLVILDLIMPDMDGTVTFNRVRELYPQMNILMSSGYAINEQINTLMQKGCNGFIQKPYSISMLSQKVRQILNEKGSRKEE